MTKSVTISIQMECGIDELALGIAWAGWEFYQADILGRAGMVMAFVANLSLEDAVMETSRAIVKYGLPAFSKGPNFRDSALAAAKERAEQILGKAPANYSYQV